jgi:hypothetical protein
MEGAYGLRYVAHMPMWGKGRVDTGSVARKEAKRALSSRDYNRGLKEEARRLKEEGEAPSRRREAKAVRAGWKSKSIAKKVR